MAAAAVAVAVAGLRSGSSRAATLHCDICTVQARSETDAPAMLAVESLHLWGTGCWQCFCRADALASRNYNVGVAVGFSEVVFPLTGSPDPVGFFGLNPSRNKVHKLHHEAVVKCGFVKMSAN